MKPHLKISKSFWNKLILVYFAYPVIFTAFQHRKTSFPDGSKNCIFLRRKIAVKIWMENCFVLRTMMAINAKIPFQVTPQTIWTLIAHIVCRDEFIYIRRGIISKLERFFTVKFTWTRACSECDYQTGVEKRPRCFTLQSVSTLGILLGNVAVWQTVIHT